MMIRQSQAYIAIVFILGILLVGFTITVLMKPMKVVYDATYNDSAVSDDVYQQFYTRSTTTWIWLPLLFAIGMIMWVLLKSHEQGGA